MTRPETSPLLATTDDAITAAKTLIRTARYGAIAALEAGAGQPTGYPIVTRTNVATTPEGHPIFLMSDLAAHTKAIKADARTSLLVGEPGKGDPLAHPRLTLIGRTERVQTETEADQQSEARLRARYLARHPKAELYNQLPDFFIYRLTIERALFNAGFGKAYELKGEELCLEAALTEQLAPSEAGIISHMNEDHADAIRLYAVKLLGEDDGHWRLCGVDPEGADLALGEKTARLPFRELCLTPDQIRNSLVAFAQSARA